MFHGAHPNVNTFKQQRLSSNISSHFSNKDRESELKLEGAEDAMITLTRRKNGRVN